MNFDNSQSDKSIWPRFPYKGLSYYEPEDMPIFAGRDQDLINFSRVISNYSNRVIILHGRTGCGKSSFLRANVIPFLEKHEHGFQFLKTEETKQRKALFVRSTDSPLIMLSEVLFDFLSKDFKIKTPVREKNLNLSRALSGYVTAKDFRENAGNNPEQMIETMISLSGILPRTLVIIIDQAEEVIAITHRKEGDTAKSNFFDFLSLFSRIDIDIKILIALRTEYFGEFHNTLIEHELKMSSVDGFFLKELDDEKLISAIIRPTSLENYENYGCPRDQYKFSYEEKLPEIIVDDLKQTTLLGGLLPVMQIICARLYDVTKQRAEDNKEWIITKEDYKELGKVERQVEAYLEEVLTKLCRNNGIKLSEIQLEIARWKNILLMLTKKQVDGTVTTDFKTEEDLYTASLKEESILDFKEAMNFLSDDQQRIIRKSEIFHVKIGLNVTCYSLGHDAIGLALQNYIPQKKQIKSEESVFICYAKEDIETAKKIYVDLKNEGIKSWLDTEDLLPGQNWKVAIRETIEYSSHVLVLLSSNSISKKKFCSARVETCFEVVQ